MTKNMKRILVLLASAGVIAVVVGGSTGTFASFNAQVVNAGNTVTTGTLFLHDTNGSTTCTSESDSGNLNTTSPTGCAVLFSVDKTTIADGGTYSVNLALANAGNLNATGISFDENGNGCVDSKPTIATLNSASPPLDTGNPLTSLTVTALSEALIAGTQIQLHEGANTQTFTVSADAAASDTTISVTSATPTFAFTNAATVSLAAFGSGLCSQLKLQIQEDTDNTYGTPVTNSCAFPASGTAVCGSTGTLLSDSGFASFQPLTLKSGTAGNTLQQLSAKKTRYFTITVLAPAHLPNTVQNDQAQFDLRWQIVQA